MSKYTPLVSVIIPNYNHAAYLDDRIKTVLAQSYENFEVVILDDNSNDDSRAIIEKFRKELRVKSIIYNSENSGNTFKQWNAGIAEADGDFIWIAESDDLADKNFLRTIMRGFTDSDVILSFCQSYRMNCTGKITGDWYDFMKKADPTLFNNDFIIDGAIFIDRALIYRNTIPNASSVVFRKKTYIQLGGADITLPYCSDWLIWLKMATIGKVAFTTQPLNYFRYHNHSVIAKAGKSGELFFKKYDIELRNLFESYIHSKDQNHFKELLQKNSALKKNEEKVEAIAYNISNKNYFAAFFNLLRFSIYRINSPREVISLYLKILNYLK